MRVLHFLVETGMARKTGRAPSGLTGSIMHTTHWTPAILALAAALAVNSDNAVAQQAAPQASEVAKPRAMQFEQPRLKIAFNVPPLATTSRTEQPTYDEVRVALPNKAGELYIWTYSRRSYSAAELLLAQQKDQFLDAQVEVRKMGPLPVLLLRKSRPEVPPFVTRSIIDRPNFDWVYVLETEAATKEASDTLSAVIESIRPL